MAINKVQFGSNTIMDITDTTTEAEDVIEGKVFYAKSGVRSTGSLGDATQSTHGLMSVVDKIKLDNAVITENFNSVSIASFNDAAQMNAVDVTVDVDSIQDLHGYDNPWPAGGGKNLFDGPMDKVVSGNVTEGFCVIDGGTSFIARVKKNTTYTVKDHSASYGNRFRIVGFVSEPSSTVTMDSYQFFFNNDISPREYTFNSEDYEYIVFTCNSTVFDQTCKAQIEIGSTATSYTPYSNICPISGWTGANVVVSNVAPNADKAIIIEPIQQGTGDPSPNNMCPILPGLTFQRDDETTLAVYGGTLNVTTGLLTVDRVMDEFDGSNDEAWRKLGATSASAFAMFIPREHFHESSNEHIKANYLKTISQPVTWGNYDNWISANTSTGFVTGIKSITDVDSWKAYLSQNPLQVCYKLATPITYPLTTAEVTRALSALNNAVYPISWQSIVGTVYGGMLDVTTGLLTVDMGNIANYAGETLPGAWISSMDVYTAGGTPTTGAQVVYELATPQTYQLTPTQIALLEGVNNVWADTGNITITYKRQDALGINENINPAYIGAKTIQTAVNSPTANGTTTSFIDSITQNEQGVITPTKKSIPMATTEAAGLMSTIDKIKLDRIGAMIGATSSNDGISGLVPAPTTTDVNKFLAGDGTYKDGGQPMVVLSYGSSTWDDFIEAYTNHVIVYCRASSNSNPASGTQGRMAFMAYVNNSDNPTEVEFQYYRSVSSHSATQMGDQVFIYKLNKTNGWSVTTREASIKQISAGSNGNLTVTWNSNKVTIDGGLPAVTSSDNDKSLKVVNGAWATYTPDEVYTKSETDNKIAQSMAKVTETIGTHVYTASTIDNVNTLFKANDIVYINLEIRGNNGMTFPTNTDLFSIPSGFRPSENVRLPALMHHKTADVWVSYFVTVTSAGRITQDWTSSCDGISISSFYML